MGSQLMKIKPIGKNKFKMIPKQRIADQIKFLFGLKGNGKLKTITCKILEYEIDDEDKGKTVTEKVD